MKAMNSRQLQDQNKSGILNIKTVKYKIEQYAENLSIFQVVVPIGAGWFLGNFLGKEVSPIFGGFPYFPDSEGYLTFRVPNWDGKEQVPWLSIADDFGDIVQGIFLNPERFRLIPICPYNKPYYLAKIGATWLGSLQ